HTPTRDDFDGTRAVRGGDVALLNEESRASVLLQTTRPVALISVSEIGTSHPSGPRTSLTHTAEIARIVGAAVTGVTGYQWICTQRASTDDRPGRRVDQSRRNRTRCRAVFHPRHQRTERIGRHRPSRAHTMRRTRREKQPRKRLDIAPPD